MTNETIDYGWTRYTNDTVIDAALGLARGCYQRNLLLGNESLSGSTLRGRAAKYSGRYAASRENLLGRIRRAGLTVGEVREAHGKRVLVIGA